MSFEKGQIVRSRNGRDAGRLFIVMSAEPDFIYLVDGKRRRVEAPKRKSAKHIELVGECAGRAAEKLLAGESPTNGEVRKTLAQFQSGEGTEKTPVGKEGS